MDPQAIGVPGDIEWISQRDSGAKTVDTLNRFLGGLVRETWDDLDRALRITENTPDFSGILPLGDPALRNLLAKRLGGDSPLPGEGEPQLPLL